MHCGRQSPQCYMQGCGSKQVTKKAIIKKMTMKVSEPPREFAGPESGARSTRTTAQTTIQGPGKKMEMQQQDWPLYKQVRVSQETLGNKACRSKLLRSTVLRQCYTSPCRTLPLNPFTVIREPASTKTSFAKQAPKPGSLLPCRPCFCVSTNLKDAIAKNELAHWLSRLSHLH